MISQLRTSIMVLTILTLLTGIGYPILITAVAHFVFPRHATGSLIVVNDTPVGSELIGQEFRSPAYFWGRPSATAPYAYNATASAGSNLGPLNPALHKAVATRLSALRTSSTDLTPVPIDLVTASASGLDPHISPAAAEYQVARVAQERGISEERVREVVRALTEPRTFGILGEPRVNVLRLNLGLNAMRGAQTPSARMQWE